MTEERWWQVLEHNGWRAEDWVGFLWWLRDDRDDPRAGAVEELVLAGGRKPYVGNENEGYLKPGLCGWWKGREIERWAGPEDLPAGVWDRLEGRLSKAHTHPAHWKVYGSYREAYRDLLRAWVKSRVKAPHE